jgi:hypothetical protein
MSKMKGPAIFLAQFAAPEAPFDSLSNISRGPASWVTGAFRCPPGKLA